MYNVLAIFRSLIPTPAVVAGQVVAQLDIGLYKVQLPDGSFMSAKGTTTVGQTVLIRGDLIESSLPAASIDTVDI